MADKNETGDGADAGIQMTAVTMQPGRSEAGSSGLSGAVKATVSGPVGGSAGLAPGKMLGKCRIDKEIGRGGMGTVYLAQHTVMDVPVAIKIMSPGIAGKDPQFAERFLREIRLASKIRHKNAVNVMDAGQDESSGLLYVVQEYVDGGTVRDLLRKGPLSESQALDIAIGVTEALVAAGEHKIVHRDIKPENIMLTRKGEVKLADLGIAKEITDNQADLTMSHVAMGTPAYMAPEQAMDARTVDARADLYSLGATLFYMVCGCTPYSGETPLAVVAKLMREPTPDPRTVKKDVSEPLAKLILRFMAKEPKDRPADAEGALAELKQVRGIHSTPVDMQKMATDLMNEMRAMRADMSGTGDTAIRNSASGGATRIAPPAVAAATTGKSRKGMFFGLAAGGCLVLVFLLVAILGVLWFVRAKSAERQNDAAVARLAEPATVKDTSTAHPTPVSFVKNGGASPAVGTTTTTTARAAAVQVMPPPPANLAALPVVKVTTEMLWQELPPAPAQVIGVAEPAGNVGAAPRKVAVFVNNRAGAQFNDFVRNLEDKVIASVSGGDFALISTDDSVQALNQFAVDGGAVADRNTLGTQADRLLADQTTALRLARNMGADFMMLVNLSSLTAVPKSLAAAGIQGSMLNYNLGVNYRICEGVTGSSLDGGNFSVRKSTRSGEANPAVDPAIIDEMLNQVSQDVNTKLSASAARIKAQPLPDDVEILIAAAPRDLQGNEISLPNLSITEDNKMLQADSLLPVQLAATIEIDGMAAGTTPARLRVAPGMHKVRLSRPGFEDVNLTINAKEGLSLTPAMTLSADGFRRWQEIRAFLTALDVTREISSAQSEALRGYAQMLRQSGYKVDYSLKVQGDHKSDINVNTQEAPTFVEKKSIYSVE